MVVATQESKIVLLPGQAALLADFNSSVLAAIAGTGSGKTMLGYWWLHSRMEALPGNTWGMAEPTYNMLGKIILVSSDPVRPSLKQYFENVGHHPDWVSKKELILGTDFGQVYLGSADNPDSMQGAAVKGYWLDESGQMKVLAHDTARQRCSMMRGQVLHTTTPYNLGALKTDIWDKRGEKGTHVETWRSIDRPGFPIESYEAERRRLPPWRFAMMYDAKFDRPAGIIYGAFNEVECLIDPKPVPMDWPVYSGHDFGANNPCALFYAMNPGTGDYKFQTKPGPNEVILFHTYLPGPGRGAFDHVQEWREIVAGRRFIKAVGGNKTTEEEVRQLYRVHGWSISEPKIGHVEPRINKVIEAHQSNRIYVPRDQRAYLDEKRAFARELDESGMPTIKIADESSYHCMSAEQYIISDFMPETVRGGHGLPPISMMRVA